MLIYAVYWNMRMLDPADITNFIIDIEFTFTFYAQIFPLNMNVGIYGIRLYLKFLAFKLFYCPSVAYALS